MNMSNQKGFANIVLIVVIVAIVAVGGYFVFSRKSEPVAQQPTPTPTQTTTPTKTPVPPTPTPTPITSAGHIRLFEEAVNRSDLSSASKYFADRVYVVLEGSSCCGEVDSNRARQELERIKGLIFTFNPNDVVVKEYMTSVASDYPSRRVIKNSPKLYFDELSIGVESDVSQQNKASIGYKVSNNKITDLFINIGRDR